MMALDKFANCEHTINQVRKVRTLVECMSSGRKTLKLAAAARSDLEAPLDGWYRIAKKAEWKSLTDVRQTYSHADHVEAYTFFNIKGNAYRLVVRIEYRWGLVFIKHVLTHAEYDKGDWKK